MSEPLEPLRARVEARLADASGGNAKVHRIEPLAGGACQENYRVDLTLERGPITGDRSLVLRSDAKRSLAASIDRRREFYVIAAAVAVGVKTPRPHHLSEGLVREGAAAYFLEWAEGEAIGRKVVRDGALAAAREGLAKELAVELARIHAITPATAPELAEHLMPPSDPVDFALAQSRAMIATLREPHPALELAISWLAENRPPRGATTLVHGDFRTGNFLVTPRGLSAVLDWEFAHFGAPAEDLAWLALRNWRFGRLDRPIGGFGDRDVFYRAYEEAGGRRVDRGEVHYWEIFGNVRWATGCIEQGERYLEGGEQDLELIAIPKLAAEMEFEALRLIEKGI